MANPVKLHIETDKDTYQVDDDITIQVRDENGNPVEDVMIYAPTGIVDKTDKTGKAKITFQQTGTIVLQADKSNSQNISYIAGSRNIQVTRKTIELRIETNKETYQVGDNIIVRVRGESGDPVAGATVQATSGITKTDTNGEAAITINQAGTIELKTNKSDTENIAYITDRVTVIVKSP